MVQRGSKASFVTIRIYKHGHNYEYLVYKWSKSIIKRFGIIADTSKSSEIIIVITLLLILMSSTSGLQAVIIVISHVDG